MNKEADELRNVRCSDTELRDEAYMDAVSQDGENNFGDGIAGRPVHCESAHPPKARTARSDQFSGSQHFKDLETASCSRSVHAPCKICIFLVFPICRTEVCSGSGHPAEAMPLIKEVEMATSVGDLNDIAIDF